MTRAAKKPSSTERASGEARQRQRLAGSRKPPSQQPLAAAMLRLADELASENVPNERTDTVQRAEYLERRDAAVRIRETVRRFQTP